MQSNNNQLQRTSELLYTPSIRKTSIIYYHTLKDQANREYISISETKPTNKQKQKDPGKFSKQYFLVNEFQIVDIKSNRTLPLKNAYDIYGTREKPTNINVTSAFLKAILREIRGIKPVNKKKRKL